MKLDKILADRSQSRCELCRDATALTVLTVSPFNDADAAHNVVVCEQCSTHIDTASAIDVNHWRCLNEAVWSPTSAVQVIAWRVLNQLNNESWAQDLLSLVYLDEDTLAWAQHGISNTEQDAYQSLDSHGAILAEGDNVTLIKDLEVKGANFTAKRGTLVKGIHLTDKPEHIEGRVNGVRIVLLTQYLKKA